MKPPFTCKHLRSKSMFIPAAANQDTPENEPPVWGHTPHTWCNCTLSEVGPDDRAVSPETCQAPRPCFED